MADDPFRRKFLLLWPLGLLAFAVVIWLSLPLDIEGVPGGILAHQSAGSGPVVDTIQRLWTDAGLYDRALYAMYGDIAFITIYGLGAWYGGLHFMQDPAARVRRLGIMLVIAAIVFLATDYTETFAQIIQLTQQRGSDTLAGIAAAVRPVKVAAWIVTFVGVIAAFVVRRLSARAA